MSDMEALKRAAAVAAAWAAGIIASITGRLCETP